MKTGKSYIIAGLFEGRPFNSPNDITIDEKGRIYFSDPRYLGHEPIDQPVQAVYRIDTDGIDPPHHHRRRQAERRVRSRPTRRRCTSSATTTATPASAGIDPKRRRAQGARWRCWPTTWPPTARRSSARCWSITRRRTAPTAWSCDKEGNLYVAVRDETRPGIYVYSPEGKELGYIKTELPTNVGFGRGAGGQDALHHGRQEPVSHSAERGGVSFVEKVGQASSQSVTAIR